MEFILKHCSRKEVIGNANYRESYVKRNCYMVISIVAMAKPAPLTKQPMLPSKLT